MFKIRVFVSSTWMDLQEERQCVEQALNRMRTTNFDGMEYFGSREETPKQVCLEHVDESDVYIGIFAFRYGSIDEETQKSMTELEYRRAGERGIHRLVYLKSDKFADQLNPDWKESNPVAKAKLDMLKEELTRKHTVQFFENSYELAAKVTADLHNYIIQHFLPNPLKRAEELLNAGSFKSAAELIGEIVKQFPKHPKANLLYALALLAGRNPEQLPIQRIKEIEALLNTARADSTSDAFYVASVALAVIRYDFYEDIGQHAEGLSSREIAKELEERSPSLDDYILLKHINATEEAQAILGITW